MIEALHYAVLFFAWIPGINLLLQAVQPLFLTTLFLNN